MDLIGEIFANQPLPMGHMTGGREVELGPQLVCQDWKDGGKGNLATSEPCSCQAGLPSRQETVPAGNRDSSHLS